MAGTCRHPDPAAEQTGRARGPQRHAPTFQRKIMFVYERARKSGRRWAARHPFAEPEEYKARAESYASIPSKGKVYSEGWLSGVLAEYWNPTEEGR